MLIFSLDPRHNMSEQHAGALAGAMGTLGTLACLAHLHRGALGLTDVTAPLSFYIVALGFLINPLRVLHFEGRVWLLKVLVRIALRYWRKKTQKPENHSIAKRKNVS